MPSTGPFTNTTHTSAPQTNANHPVPSGSVPSSSHAASHSIAGQNYAGELYYGLGRFLRNQWDYIYQNFWGDSGASPEGIARKQRDIYVAGLKECVEHLKLAIENVRKNPHDRASVNKVDDLAQHYAAYVNVHPSIEFHVVQQELFQPIREQVERLSDASLKRKLKMVLPVLAMDFSESENQKSDALAREGEYGLGLSRSYYEEENHFKNVPKFFAKEKRAVEQVIFPANFGLNALGGSNGFTIPGVASSKQLGFSVSTAGDVNGDSLEDFVLGAYNASSGNDVVYIIFGSRNGFGSNFNLSSLNGTNGFTLFGIASGAQLSVSVSTAGDMNGDNITDIVLGVWRAVSFNSTGGIAYVVFGSRNEFGANFNLSALNGTNGFAIPGIVSGGGLGVSVGTAGDINGDNITDLVLGAYGGNPSAAYVIFGSRDGFGSSFNLSTLNGTNGFIIQGITTSPSVIGVSVSTAGDVNGDNIADLVLGASAANAFNGTFNGTAYIIFGSRNGFNAVFNLSRLNGTNGFTVPGIASGGELGYSVSTAGDINGDNITDLILGAPTANMYDGTAYIVFGSRNRFNAVFNLSGLNGTNGFMVSGIASGGQQLGVSVSTAGDINGDNIADLILGAPTANAYDGMAYVIFGSRNGFDSSFNLSRLNGANGFRVSGIALGGELGYSVSTAGDVNGDNIADLILGAPANAYDGMVYVIFGQNTGVPFGSVTSCPSAQPLTLRSNNIQISKGQTLRLTPNELSASCGNSTVLNFGTVFQVISINHAQFQKRNSSGLWNNISSFFGKDLSQGNIALIQDNSTNAPQINFTATDGQTNLPETKAVIRFNTTGNNPKVNGIDFSIQTNNSTLLNASQFQITDTEGKLDNVVIAVDIVEGGYFSLVSDPYTPITDFTYYQLQDRQIQFIHNGSTLPAITFSIDDGLGKSVKFSPLVSFFSNDNPASPSVSVAVVVGSTVGALVAVAAAGLGVFGIFKYRQHQEHEGHTVQPVATERLR